MKLYGLYDMKQNEICVGIFKSPKEIAKYTGNTYGTVRSAISRQHKLKDRYLPCRIEVRKNESKNN